MSIVTVWRNANTGAVLLHQLSDDPDDGTPDEQIAYLSGLQFLADHTCVSKDYTGTVPDTDASLWRWNGESVTAPPNVPASITPVQLRLTLSIYGLLTQVEAEVAKLGDTERIYWQYANSISRSNPILLAMAVKFNLSKEQVDDMFVFAASL